MRTLYARITQKPTIDFLLLLSLLLKFSTDIKDIINELASTIIIASDELKTVISENKVFPI